MSGVPAGKVRWSVGFVPDYLADDVGPELLQCVNAEVYGMVCSRYPFGTVWFEYISAYSYLGNVELQLLLQSFRFIPFSLVYRYSFSARTEKPLRWRDDKVGP